ncbi:MAG: insulinase family protein [Candidatus Roizmanbacteria bacterium]|nr:insulinase family protein [Candidatus Roizmanbacteria bacterium]
MYPQTFTLKNGLQVIFVDTKTFPTLTTLLLVGAGSRYENENNNGIAHFLEHMFYKGSKKYPNPKIISQIIEGMGGHWNAFTSKDYTGYYIKAATDHFPEIIDILSDILLNSLFNKSEIEKEKGVIVEEINMYEDTPQRRIGEIFEGLIYKDSSLGFDIAGSKETVTSFDRKTFLSYMNSLYHPNNAVLVVAGGLSARQPKFFDGKQQTAKNLLSSPFNTYLEIIEDKFGNWKSGEKSTFEKINQSQTRPQILVHHKKTEQAHFCLGFPTFGINDKRRRILNVLITILGVGASSKLFQEVREKKGLCYYISTGAEYYFETGSIVTQAGIAKDVEKVKIAVAATLTEHENMVKGNFFEEDIIRAKEMLKGRLLLSMEDSFNIAHFFGNKKLLENKLETPEEIITKIMSVTKSEIVDLAKEIFIPKNLNFALIGPFETKDFENILNI